MPITTTTHHDDNNDDDNEENDSDTSLPPRMRKRKPFGDYRVIREPQPDLPKPIPSPPWANNSFPLDSRPPLQPHPTASQSYSWSSNPHQAPDSDYDDDDDPDDDPDDNRQTSLHSGQSGPPSPAPAPTPSHQEFQFRPHQPQHQQQYNYEPLITVPFNPHKPPRTAKPRQRHTTIGTSTLNFNVSQHARSAPNSLRPLAARLPPPAAPSPSSSYYRDRTAEQTSELHPQQMGMQVLDMAPHEAQLQGGIGSNHYRTRASQPASAPVSGSMRLTRSQHPSASASASVSVADSVSEMSGTETNTFAAPARPSRKQKRYPCDVCGQIFTRSGDVRRHKDSRHDQSGGCRCPYCDRVLTRQDALQRHWDKYCRKKSKRHLDKIAVAPKTEPPPEGGDKGEGTSNTNGHDGTESPTRSPPPITTKQRKPKQKHPISPPPPPLPFDSQHHQHEKSSYQRLFPPTSAARTASGSAVPGGMGSKMGWGAGGLSSLAAAAAASAQLAVPGPLPPSSSAPSAPPPSALGPSPALPSGSLAGGTDAPPPVPSSSSAMTTGSVEMADMDGDGDHDMDADADGENEV